MQTLEHIILGIVFLKCLQQILNAATNKIIDKIFVQFNSKI